MDPAFTKDFAAAFDLPPVRRDLLSVKPTDAALSVSYDAAIRARTWLDPDPAASNVAFQNMVESVSSGRKDVSNSVESFNTELTAGLAPYKK